MSAKETAPAKLASARKGALKRNDAEPLTRQDLQYDVLNYIFSDAHQVFTDPFSNPAGRQVPFRDLYVSAILHAPKTARSVRDKIAESDVFATDIAMLSLLANVGRVNTSMAFFPETRTALRTYHPIPALQRFDGNLTDAPRIRNALKSVILPSESRYVPNSPFELLGQREDGPIPTTSIANLLFILAQHSTKIGNLHFNDDTGLEFTDLFQPVPVPSAERGRAFLWLVYHYLESTEHPNPFADPSPSPDSSSESTSKKRPNPNVAPRMHRVDPSTLAHENVDTPEEKEYGEKMTEQRRVLVTDKEKQEAASNAAPREEGANGVRDNSGTPAPSAAAVAPPVSVSGKSIKPKGKTGRKAQDQSVKEGYTKFRYDTTENTQGLSRKPSLQLQPDGVLPLGPPASYNSHSRHQDHPAPPPAENMSRGRKARRSMRTEPYEFVHSPERTMFQQAWHRISTQDPLYDSDEIGDEHVRLDLTRRLQTLNRLRGRSPTPKADLEPNGFRPSSDANPNYEASEAMQGIEEDHRVPIHVQAPSAGTAVPVMHVDGPW